MRALAALAAYVPAAPAGAQVYPAKPVRIVVGFPAGGPTDIVTRTLAPKLTEALGQVVLKGAEPVGGSPEEFGAFVKSEIAKWANLVTVAKMKAD